MEAGNWIALAAVAVGLVGNGVTWKLANRRFSEDRRLADRAALATIFDAAVIDIHNVVYVLDAIKVGLLSDPEEFFRRPEAVYRELEQTGRALELRAERMRIRLASDLPWKALDSLSENALAIFRAASVLRRLNPQASPAALKPVEKISDEKCREIAKQRDVFDENLRVFRRYAFQAVGVDPVKKIEVRDPPRTAGEEKEPGFGGGGLDASTDVLDN